MKHVPAPVLRQHFVAFHGASGTEPEDPQCRFRRVSGCGSRLALRLGPGRAPESPAGHRGGGRPHQHPARIHLMAGRLPAGSHRAAVAKEMEAIFVQNLQYSADVLLQEGITGLIEPINTRITDPTYFLDSPHQAAAIVEKVGKPNMKLQMDVFHWQIMDGNLTQNIHKYLPLIGHIQIAQVPGRNEPDSAGELNYRYLFNLLETLGYQGYIGCEYKPLRSTNEGLGWLKDHWTLSQ
ncbi:putative hydroxypyruvate isomerase isoform X3 [Thalassophryne amazonica]|uniref:putative hydroxypyruvate isomerase isoform X3 n=1 Tax=Thalassophryne amazonica TaxID=390379 RepID=UPI0014720889|nr:putative hydroxypyruvate isomerase isoform X3 [Thalassophryne amazonica]